MFGRSLSQRAKLLDAGIPVIQRALQGERFRDGTREVFVRPLPLQKPYPPILLGGGVPATAIRAARFGVGLYPMAPSVIPLYKEECAKLGRRPGPIVFSMAQVHVSEDPEKTWREVEPHVLHVVRSYSRWTEGTTSSSPYAGLSDIASIKRSGIYQVLTPAQAVALAGEADKIGADLTIAPVYGGMNPDVGWQCIELFLAKVLPHIKKRPVG
jgi:alkanesulfonate monooxygenase SsuD/methylene tetrahydromethanopterin reductase-like flavin-dependent oxidoreductase (luciferase family)